MSVGLEVWVHHANQLKATSIDNNKTQYRTAPEVLLDTFEITPPRTDSPISLQAKNDTTSLLPKRWANRRHRPVTSLQLDTITRSYEPAQRGGVSVIWIGLKQVSCMLELGHADWLFLITSAPVDTWKRLI
ncbi:unnamed protein product [Schistosoma rodhaini]|uniref:Uncharacterized protein n=1 Tax=Schistosoma rodhaini TaxID=6188 RepID=A0AA85EUM5_9TREM|nr:unnamed protein product [Schistosoma rodhaini]